MQYLRNAQSDFDPVFFYLFVFSSSVTYVKTEKMVFTPPPPLALSVLWHCVFLSDYAIENLNSTPGPLGISIQLIKYMSKLYNNLQFYQSQFKLIFIIF